ncbi:MAG: flagellar motor protein MotB [Thiohalomonadaceae bacterium]
MQKPAPDAPDPRHTLLSQEERETLRAELAAVQRFLSARPTLRTGKGSTSEESSWLITYLDMVTLMLVLFVVLLAYTRPEAEEGLHWKQGSIFEMVNYRNPSIVPSLNEHLPVSTLGTSEPVPPDVPDALEEAIAKGRELEGVELHVKAGIVELRVRDGVLFESGEAELHRDGRRLLDRLAPMLANTPGRIAVEGHTDNVPIDNDLFPSNWELSAARASGVVRYLIGRGLRPERLQAVGFADTRPVATNDTATGRAQNRRVSLVIQNGTDAPR